MSEDVPSMPFAASTGANSSLAAAPREIVLLGIGHTNAHIVKSWRDEGLPNARLTCISDYAVACYSGMLPGVLAGHYPVHRMQIDLERLCDSAKARLIIGSVEALDPDKRQLYLQDGKAIPYDVLSIGVGSVPQLDLQHVDGTATTIKPLQTFLKRLDERASALSEGSPSRIVVVGGGAGGIEIAFCLPRRWASKAIGRPPEMTLIDVNDRLPYQTANSTQRHVHRLLENRRVRLLLNRRVESVRRGNVRLDDSQIVKADLVIWATGAVAAPWLRTTGLATDARGFVRTHKTLQAIGHEAVFAVGDCGSIDRLDVPKAGVFAVRQGPVLWQNIRRYLADRTLLEYKPQATFLKIMNTGDGKAIAEYKGFAAYSRWSWRLKDHIDRKFIAQYQR